MKWHKLIPQALVFAGLSVFFQQNFMHNLFDLGDPLNPKQWRARCFEQFQGDMENAVRETLVKTRRDGIASSGGMFMYPTPTNTYDRAFALHGKIYNRLYEHSELDVESFIRKANQVVAAIFAIMLAAFALYVFHQFGTGAAISFVVFIALSDYVVFIGRNLYQLYFLRLLPAVLSLMLFPLLLKGGRFRFPHYLIAVGGAVMLLAFCCNEFITCVILSVGVGPVFYGVLTERGWKQILKWVTATVAVATGAVAVGIVAIMIQNYLFYHSWDKAAIVIHAIAGRMFAVDPRFNDYGWTAPPEISVFQIFEQYLTLPVVGIPFRQNSFPGYFVYLSFFSFLFALIPFAMLSLVDGRRYPRFEANRRILLALSAATFWGLASSLSWAFLMKGHMWHHIHMAAMIFYLPYLPMLYVLIGKGLSVVTLQIWDSVKSSQLPAGTTGIPGVAATRRKTGRTQ